MSSTSCIFCYHDWVLFLLLFLSLFFYNVVKGCHQVKLIWSLPLEIRVSVTLWPFFCFRIVSLSFLCLFIIGGNLLMSGAGRKKWEAAWRTAMERYQNQKSPLSASSPETPGSSQPGNFSYKKY